MILRLLDSNDSKYSKWCNRTGRGPWEAHLISKFVLNGYQMPTWIHIVLKLWLAKRSIEGILNCNVSTPLTCVACVCLCPLAGLLVFKWMLNVNYSNYSQSNFHSNVLALRPEDRCDSCTSSIVQTNCRVSWCELYGRSIFTIDESYDECLEQRLTDEVLRVDGST